MCVICKQMCVEDTQEMQQSLSFVLYNINTSQKSPTKVSEIYMTFKTAPYSMKSHLNPFY